MRTRISEALKEVLEWKDACYRDVAHLPRKAALRKHLENAEQTARALGLKCTAPTRPMVAAEKQEDYGSREGAKARRRSPKKTDVY